jgi:hypothetical protein
MNESFVLRRSLARRGVHWVRYKGAACRCLKWSLSGGICFWGAGLNRYKWGLGHGTGSVSCYSACVSEMGARAVCCMYTSLEKAVKIEWMGSEV